MNNNVTRFDEFNIPEEISELLIPLTNPGQKHVACVLLVDISGSMNNVERNGRRRIDELNEGLKAFGEAIKADSYAKGVVDVCVISFDSKVETVIPFQPASSYQAPNLRAEGMTALNEAIITGLDFIEQRKALYKQTPTPYWRPWMFLLTDGYPTDGNYEQAAKQRLSEAIKSNKVAFFPMGIGEKANYRLLSQYNNNGTVLKADADNFAEVFEWLSDGPLPVPPKAEPFMESIRIAIS